MRIKFQHIFLFILVNLFLQSCSVSKFLAEDELLYKGAEIEFTHPEFIGDKGDLKTIIKEKLYPEPNKKFLGFFYTKLWIYKKVQPNESREKGFKHWLKNKLGEKPIFIDEVNTDLMGKVINKAMQDQGYFATTTENELKKKKKTAEIIYTISNSKQKIIDSIIFPSTSPEIDSIFSNYKLYLTKENRPYNLERLEKDRTNLSEIIRSLGYFDFKEQDIYFVIDTSLRDNLIQVYYKVKMPKNGGVHKKYYISDIQIYPTFASLNSELDSSASYKRSYFYKGYNVHQNYEFIGKKSLNRNILIEQKSLFSVKDYIYTSERLTNLDVFNFVNLNYNKNEEDSITVAINLTPGKYQSVGVDVEASTSNRSFLGSSLALNYKNRNLLRGAEKLTIKASGGTEFQFVNSEAALNILDFNLEVNLSIPRLLNIFKNKKIKSSTPPRTNLLLQENYQKWLQYYTINSVNFSFGYDWKTQKNHHHKLNPITFNIISLLNTTDEFETILDENPLLKTSFDNSVIIGRNYNYSVSSQKDNLDKSYVYFNGYIELAGNGNFIIAKSINRNGDIPYEILGIPFSQYTKLDLELKHIWKPSSSSTIASRFNTGVGFAYGNSSVLPYIKQFYMGGPNTIRAFAFRTIGPGRFSSNSNSSGISNPIEQAGDIKLLMNLEYRYNIFSFIKGAFFLDAGNIWLRKNDPERPDSQFKIKEFYKQLALGTGLGLRLDFDFFVIRADLGIPLHKPYEEEGNRWIYQFPEQGFNEWRKENMTWNIAIGYPF